MIYRDRRDGEISEFLWRRNGRVKIKILDIGVPNSSLRKIGDEVVMAQEFFDNHRESMESYIVNQILLKYAS